MVLQAVEMEELKTKGAGRAPGEPRSALGTWEEQSEGHRVAFLMLGIK